MSKKALEIRKSLKKKRPSFHREDSHKVKGVKRKWRKPTGRHSKVRHQLRGYVKRVEPGYRSPVLIRGFHKSGIFPVIVNNFNDLNKIDKEKQGIVIASTIGKRKAVVLLKKAKELGINVLNVKDSDAFIKKVDDFIKARKEKKDSIKKKKETKAKEKKKKAEETLEKRSFSAPQKPGVSVEPKLAEKVAEAQEKQSFSVEDKKKQEKKELDKTLSKRQR